MDPFTPRTRPGGRKKNLGLSAKEYSKVRVSRSREIVLDRTFYRLVLSRPNRTDGAPRHSLHCYLLFCRESQPPLF
ncbi:hypothetical protein DFJ58DRAFT_819744 [Suillus subalutaceus]|uniref:uncharacterized protein n=1 Tax=Suillus subalutaceus TaxID=48586 RepID=UPI001B865B14|nr:uncharacterized protein DFJ58DRAFT_819744 [Suillus subalutaceus]KAG1836040.1 hypothetical protein DFJ58DRAFT_819744 [Suillus subalutaceus]